ncbi:MAG: hypothetical protein K2F57_04035, partial [Candidatus Gastranaerophilales bacterium]|nr:hypothetical protein [Candidatus Gastranaerophilales bacterium]
MVNINGINTVSNISSSHNTSKRTQYHRSDNKFYPYLKDKKITLNEGSELFARGIINQTKELFTNIINHPIKTAAIIGGTTLGLMSLPLIGIST